MRTKLRITAPIVVAGALMGAMVAPAAAEHELPDRPDRPTTWSVDLVTGQPTGVRIDRGGVRLDPGNELPGLLTFTPHRLDAVTGLVEATVTGALPAGTTATVDVRGRSANGGWTEWVPTASGASAVLPEPTAEVQARLVLTAAPTAPDPVVEAVTLTATPTDRSRLDRPLTERASSRYRVYATREGLVGRTTANGHVITPRDHFVALPSRRALSPRGSGDYSVQVCAPNGRCAFAPVWDVGPWNTRDDYWNPGALRQQWRDLPRGVPQAQAAHSNGYNGGRDQFGRRVTNPAGIDLGDGLFWDALGLRDNSWVTVDYLWTGDARLSTVREGAPVDVRAAPDAGAEVVGVAAARAAVPVDCVVSTEAGRWLRIGAGQYIDAAGVPRPGPVGPCAPDRTTVDPPAGPAVDAVAG